MPLFSATTRSMPVATTGGSTIAAIERAQAAGLVIDRVIEVWYKVRKDGSFEDEPDKTGIWSHLQDAIQYLCMHADAQQSGKYRSSVARAVEKVSLAAWT